MIEEEFILTPSQEIGKQKLEDFLNGSERIFLFTGKPGVGKTTLNKITLAEQIAADKSNNKKGNKINVAGITLAHHAKNVLGEHIPNVFTFAKAYGMKEAYDEKTGARRFEIDKYNKDQIIGKENIPVFVHDEVSQYTPSMLKVVLDYTPMYSKIIFMGDKAQLPPIDPDGTMKVDEDSPVFELDIPESCKHELTERVRQAVGNPILELSDIIREEIFGKQNISRIINIIKTPNIDNGIGYSFISYNEILTELKNKNRFSTALIGFRNKKCIDPFNYKIRNYLLNNPLEKIVEGDMICMRDNFYVDDYGNMTCAFTNSQVFSLHKIDVVKKKFTIDKNRYYIECYEALVKGFKYNFITPTEKGQISFDLALGEVAEKCKKKEISWERWWDFKKSFCSYGYAYAITVYKAQGSTYETVYVDINDILLTGPLTPKRKLQAIYTAITRAKNDVYFLKGKK